MNFCDALDDGQPQSAAAGTRSHGTIEPFHYSGQFRSGMPRPLSVTERRALSLLMADIYPDRRSRFGVTHGIVDQIAQQDAQQHRIATHLHFITFRQFESDILA